MCVYLCLLSLLFSMTRRCMYWISTRHLKREHAAAQILAVQTVDPSQILAVQTVDDIKSVKVVEMAAVDRSDDESVSELKMVSLFGTLLIAYEFLMTQ